MEGKKRLSLDDPGGAASALRRFTPSPSRLGLRRSRTNLTLSSASSIASSSSSSPGHDEQTGCVARDISSDDCALNMFLVWVAVKRNTCTKMTAEERRECPLLRCRQRFPNHESMLQHLYECDELGNCEYWCYDCGRVERFTDAKCKRCIGHPSKRRRIMGMAKSFFSSLGSKDGGSRSSSAASMSSSKGGERCLDDDLFDLEGNEGLSTAGYDEGFELDVNAIETELPVHAIHEIHEIDSHEIALPTIFEEFGDDAPELVVQQQQPPPPPVHTMPQLSSMPISPPAFPPAELESMGAADGSMISWPPPPQLPTVSPVSWIEGHDPKMAARPALQLHTSGLEQYRQHVKRSRVLAPSTSVRSTASTDTTASSDSAASYLISPMSQWSGGWTHSNNGIESNLTSPDDDILPGNPFGTSCKPINGVDQGSADYNVAAFTTSELPADLPMLDTLSAPSTSLDNTTGFLEPPSLTFGSTISTNDSSFLSNISLPNNPPTNDYQLEPAPSLHAPQPMDLLHGGADSLVSLAWNALQLHVSKSMAKLELLQNNHVLNQFRSMSPDAVGFMALDTLVKVLDGAVVESPVELLSFIHLVYSFFVVIHQQDAPNRDNTLFSQALGYGRHLSRKDRQAYQKIVALLWKPQDMADSKVSQLIRNNSLAAANSPSNKGKEPQREIGQNDSLMLISQYFLNELEYATINEPLKADVQISDLNIRHLKDNRITVVRGEALSIAINFIIKELFAGFMDNAALASRLQKIQQQINSGYSWTTRRLELDLIHAGKMSLSSDTFFDHYIPLLRPQIDWLYTKSFGQSDSRSPYYSDAVTLFRKLVQGPMQPPLVAAPAVEAPAAIELEDSSNDIEAFFDQITPNMATADAAIINNITSDPFNGYPLPIPDIRIDSLDDSSTTPDTATSSVTPNQATEASAFPTPQDLSVAATAATTPPTPSQPSTTETTPATAPSGTKVESDSFCEICGYRPEGDPRWFVGSMSKHKKTKHSSEPPKIYSCPFPGCSSKYTNRADNLRQHQARKGHFVDGQEEGPKPKRRKMS